MLYQNERLSTSGTIAVDPEIEAMVADLPVEFPHQPSHPVTWLDGSPADLPGVSIPSPAPANTATPANDEIGALPAIAPPRKKGKVGRYCRPRKSREHDRRSLDKSGLSRVPSDQAPLTSRRMASVTTPSPAKPSPTPSTSAPTSSPTRSKREAADERDTRAPVAYRDGGDLLKMASIGEALARRASADNRHAHAFTLNMGAKALAKAAADPKGFKGWIRRRIDAALKKELGALPGWVGAIELTPAPANRVHCHGLIAAHDHELDAIEKAFNIAATPWGSTKGKQRQVDTRIAWCRTGWAHYSTKANGRARKFLGVKSAVMASKVLRAEAQALWESLRAQQARHRALCSL